MIVGRCHKWFQDSSFKIPSQAPLDTTAAHVQWWKRALSCKSGIEDVSLIIVIFYWRGNQRERQL